MGVPLTDEPELLAKAIRLVQSLTDLPICIDSSVVEALEAGLVGLRGPRAGQLGHRRGRPDGRDPAAGQAVRRRDHRAAQRRRRDPDGGRQAPRPGRARSSGVATEEYGIAKADIVIDPLAMPIGADTGNSLVTHGDDAADPRRARPQHDLRRVQRLLRDAGPAHPRRGVAADGDDRRADQRDHGHPHPADRATPSRRPTCCSTTTSGAWPGSPPTGPRSPRPHALRHDAAMTDEPIGQFDPDAVRREGLLATPGAGSAPHDGTGRVELSFTVRDTDPERTAERQVRVPPGVTVFDSASWNGIAIDSTCGGHGTCNKCRVRWSRARRPVTRLDVRTFSREQLDDGWRLACLAQATRDLAVDVPPLTTRPKAATVGVGPPGDPAAGDPEALRRAGRADARGPADRPRPAARRDRRPRARRGPARAAPAAGGPARRRLQGHRGRRRRGADRRRAGRHHGHAVRDRVRPRHHDGRRHAARRHDRHAGRGGVDAQPAAAVRRRRDHPDQRHDDGPRGARPAPAGRARHPRRAGRAGAARRARSTPRTSTRWRSPATPR